MKDKIYNYLKNKKILILGLGREGKSTYNFIRSIDKTIKLAISDLNEIKDNDVLDDNNVILYSGDDYLNICNDYDIIIKGPGVIIKDYLSDDVKKRITCQTDLFIKFCENKVIGITGTKGKSTTSSLLYHILINTNKDAVLIGNVGVPVFDAIDKIKKDTICVMELSSHQLEFMHNSPDIGVVLNIYEEHLDHYLSMNHYVLAKKNIYRYQNSNNYIILGDSSYLSDNVIKSNVFRENIDFGIDNEFISIKDLKIPISKIKTSLVGRHNLYNISVCLTIIYILGFNIDNSIKAIANFKGLAHRLEFVGKYNDIYFYDDSIATSVESVIYAIDSLKMVDTVIIGGMDRGIEYDELVSYLNKSNVSNILLLPDTNKRIKELFDNINSKKNIVIVKDMKEAVMIAKKVTIHDKICILSPAAASYGFYKNFEERGDHFKELVKDQ